MTIYWLQQLDPKLSQGDVVQLVPLAPTVHPLSKLQKGTYKGLGEGFRDTPDCAPDSNGHHHLLSRGPVTDVIVLSHSCELDKNQSKAIVTVAQVHSVTHVNPQQRESIYARKQISYVPLPGVPVLGDCYADLRTITGVKRAHLDQRIASIAPEALEILRQSILGFFLRDEV